MLASRKAIPFLFLVSCLWCSCQTIDLYEKVTPIPAHEWKSSFNPEFRFTIKDTSVPYRLFIVLRHDEKYAYNNIWLSLSTRFPGDTAVQKVQYELPLANSEGWIGKESAMDDLYEHRIELTSRNEPLFFRRAGEYRFTISQIMREDPLLHVYNVGLRIEKQSQ
jgi:gliding motility-associated lipoprotein GldH